MDYSKGVTKGRKATGKTQLVKHLSGKKLSRKEMIQAKCYDCMGFYSDGTVDCKMVDCPLYPLMPYREGGTLKLKVRHYQ
jgi:tRNA A37 threonylcarbamoyladenosine biosynthesis protein TsaE